MTDSKWSDGVSATSRGVSAGKSCNTRKVFHRYGLSLSGDRLWWDRWWAGADLKAAVGNGVVKGRPAKSKLGEFAEQILAEIVDNAFIGSFGGIGAKLAVEPGPGEPFWPLALRVKRKGLVGKPHVEVKTEGRAFDGSEDAHVERNGVRNDFVVQGLTENDRALPEGGLTRLVVIPP